MNLYQILPKRNYKFNPEGLMNLLKTFVTNKRKGILKTIMAKPNYVYIYDCDEKGKTSIYLINRSSKNNQGLKQNIETFLAGQAEVFEVDKTLPEYKHKSTLYLPNRNNQSGKRKLAQFMNESINASILSSLTKNTRIVVEFDVYRSKSSGEQRPIMRQTTDVEIELILTVEAKTKYQNGELNAIANNISSLTAGEQYFFIDYKETFKESRISGMEFMNLMQIPTLLKADEEVLSKYYHLFPNQRTLDEKEFSKGVKIGKLSHPLQTSRDVLLDYVTARKHGFISGTTGSGKTSVFEEIARDIIHAKLEGKKTPGFTLFDPKESAALGVIDILLKFQSDGYDIDPLLKKMVYVDMQNDDYIFPISLLNKNTDSVEILDFFKTLYGDQKTIQVDRHMTTAIECLLKDPEEEHSISDLEKIFSKDSNYREVLASRLRSNIYAQDLIEFLTDTKMTPDIINPIYNRVSSFKNTPQKKLMFGVTSEHGMLSKIRTWMDEGYIILMNIKGMSDFDINVIVGYLSLQYYLTMLKRPSFSLLHMIFVDEAHKVQLPIFHTIGAVGREQGLAIWTMTQFAEQFAPDYKKELFGNINTFISMKQAPQGAYDLANQIPGGTVKPTDLTSLPDCTGYFTSEDNKAIKSVLIEAQLPYRYTNGKLVNYLDELEVQENQNKNRKFANQLMARDCLSKSEAERIVFKSHFDRKELEEYETELLSEGDSLLSVEKGNIWENLDD